MVPQDMLMADSPSLLQPTQNLVEPKWPKIISPQRHRVTETEEPLCLSASVVSYIEASKSYCKTN